MTAPRPVLEALALPPYPQVVPDAFRERLGLEECGQYGVVVPDRKAGCADVERMGGGPFVGARLPAPGWTERGERRCPTLEFSLGYCDGEQVELLGPGRGTDFYADVLDGDAPVLHHVGIYQRGIDEIERRLNAAGYPTVVSGGVDLGWLVGFEFKYFDTREELGVYLEMLDPRYLGGRPADLRRLVERAAALPAWMR